MVSSVQTSQGPLISYRSIARRCLTSLGSDCARMRGGFILLSPQELLFYPSSENYFILSVIHEMKVCQAV